MATKQADKHHVHRALVDFLHISAEPDQTTRPDDNLHASGNNLDTDLTGFGGSNLNSLNA